MDAPSSPADSEAQYFRDLHARREVDSDVETTCPPLKTTKPPITPRADAKLNKPVTKDIFYCMSDSTIRRTARNTARPDATAAWRKDPRFVMEKISPISDTEIVSEQPLGNDVSSNSCRPAVARKRKLPWLNDPSTSSKKRTLPWKTLSSTPLKRAKASGETHDRPKPKHVLVAPLGSPLQPLDQARASRSMKSESPSSAGPLKLGKRRPLLPTPGTSNVPNEDPLPVSDRSSDYKRRKVTVEALTARIVSASTASPENSPVKTRTIQDFSTLAKASASQGFPSDGGKFSGYESRPETTYAVAQSRPEELAVEKAQADKKLFERLHFVFLPASNHSVARRQLVAAAISRGATSAELDGREVTHIVLDNKPDSGCNYSFVLLQLHRKKLPVYLRLVLTDWVKDCMDQGKVLDPLFYSPQVPGYDPLEVKRVRPSTALTALSEQPPNLTDENRDSTPSREEDSQEAEAEARARALSGNKGTPIYDPYKPHYPRLEALECAIAEAREEIDSCLETPTDATRSHGSEELADGIEVSPTRPKSWQDKFSCMQAHELGNGSDGNPNAATISLLKRMADCYENEGDRWRTHAYRRCIAALRNQKNYITTEKQARAIRGIGASLASKIEEIVREKRLRELESIQSEPRTQTVKLFRGIYGVGAVQAQTLYSQGFRTLNDLTERAKLTANQKVGIEHYNDFQARIPRAEIYEHRNFVKAILRGVSVRFEFVIAGSYLRGSADSGDIDFLITAKNTKMAEMRRKFRQVFINRMRYAQYLRHEFVLSDSERGAKCLGAACLPAPFPRTWRRVDFLLVPPEEWGAALLYFTGNDLFNRSMRNLAAKKSLRLSQYGLFGDVARGPGGKKETDGTLLEAESERRIFELLDVPWRMPNQRNV